MKSCKKRIWCSFANSASQCTACDPCQPEPKDEDCRGFGISRLDCWHCKRFLSSDGKKLNCPIPHAQYAFSSIQRIRASKHFSENYPRAAYSGGWYFS